MKILMIDKYYFIKGGAERYFFELSDYLQEKGHEVIPFSMKDDRNFETGYEKYFVDNIEFNYNSKKEKVANSFKILGRVIYSKHAQKKIEELINDHKPDIAHAHMIDHQISPSILATLKKYNIPVVQTVHQYKLVCPNYRLYVEEKGEICEKCIGGKFYHAIFEKCHKNSLFASALVAVESYVHDKLNLYDVIQLFHVPSRFIGSKLKQAGIADERIYHQFYSIDISKYPFHQNHEDYFLYFGRLSGEKGLFTLLNAMKKLNDETMKLLIVGDGPLRPDLEKTAGELNLKNVKFLGIKSGEELKKIVGQAKFVVVPSEWYENSPLVIYESFALGTPAIGAKIGGIPELIDENINGLLFEAGDAEQLSHRIKELYHDSKKITDFSIEARKKAEDQFSWSSSYPQILSMYEKVL